MFNKSRTIAGVFGVLLTAQAFANPTYKVFFDGGGINANSIVATNGAPAVPEGACGMSVSGADLLSFYWAQYNEFNLGPPMAEAPAGPPSSATYNFPEVALEAVVEFTGPIAEGCGEEWVFKLPLAGDWPVFMNGTPSGAGALVFQVTLPNNVDWLDAGFQVWEGSEDPWGEEPEFPSFCEQWPDACEEDPGFTYDDPCNSNVWAGICGAAIHGTGKTLAAEVLAGIATRELQALILPAVSQVREGPRRLDSAAEALERALLQIEAVRDTEFSRFRGDETGADYADAIKAQLGIAEIELRSCQNSIAVGRDGNIETNDAELAIAHCVAATQAMTASRDQMRKLPDNDDNNDVNNPPNKY